MVEIPYDLIINALIAGLLLGAFYAAVTVGVSISFGILEKDDEPPASGA